MKVLYVIEGISTAGGLERILIDKMNALSVQPDMEVVLLTVWKGQDTPAYHIDSRVTHISLEVPRPEGRLKFLFALARVLKRYNIMLGKINPDVVVHFRAIGAFLIGYGRHTCRTVFESHGIRSLSSHLWLYPRMERNVDTLVCLTETDRKEFLLARDVRVIPNFTNIRPERKPDYSQRHCLFVGRLCHQKNPQRLLQLWCRIHELHPDWILDIYGDGDMKAEVQSATSKAELEGSVVLHGHCNEMPKVYASGSIMLMTSRYEGFPLAIVEAMTCGLPVVSFDIKCGPRDLIADGETGYLIASESDEAFVDAVSRLMDDEALRREMGQKAMERARLYDKDAIIQKWVDLFKETDIRRLCTYSK